MTSIRAWIVILFAVTFAGGVGAGTLLAERERLADPGWGPLADYERMLVRQFDLSAERAHLLRSVLQHYDADVTRIRNRHLAEYTSRIEPKLREQGERYDRIIRDAVLPASARARFDRLSRGGGPPG